MILMGFCAFFTFISMLMDIKWEKVCNHWICAGWLAGVDFRLYLESETGWVHIAADTLFPLLILFPLFIFKMIGTGDIKVFMVTGSVMGIKDNVICIAVSFVIAAMAAVPILIFRCDWRERLRYFSTYVRQVMAAGKAVPYITPGKHPENIHFTIPVFLSVVYLFLKKVYL